MNRMQQWLARAANELDVRIITDFVVPINKDDALKAQALFPDLGGPLGMLVFESSQDIDAPSRSDLINRGFGISSFSEPCASEEFDIANYAEMFSEWGWTGGDRPKPEWMY